MAALLEPLLAKKVQINKVLEWLGNAKDDERLVLGEPEVSVHKQEFVTFLLNFLRDQSSQALTHGPATPVKTPNPPRSAAAAAARAQGCSERRGCRSAGGGAGSRSASRVQLVFASHSASPGTERSDSHCVSELSNASNASSASLSSACSPASRPAGSERRSGQRVSLGDYMVSPPDQRQQSPSFQSQKARRRSAAAAATAATAATSSGGQGRRLPHHGDGGGGGGAGRRGARGGGNSRFTEQTSPPSEALLNFTNLEDFPPVGSSPVSPAGSKPSRRINPTPVSAERPHSIPKTCFTSTPFAKSPSSLFGAEAPEKSAAMGSPLSLMEERELLRKEKTKRSQQSASPPSSSLAPCTPVKCGLRAETKVTPDVASPCPEPSQVTFPSELDLLAELYCTCISENLVPNIFLELFFVLQLLTSLSPQTHDLEQDSVCADTSDVLEKRYLRQVHNCVYFAVRVLESQFQLVAHLDKCTLRLLAENERVASFSSALRDRLVQALDQSTTKLSPSVSIFVHSVPFQPATDNRSNFSSDRAFHIFKKQRDIFYEALREWEDFHKEPGWNFNSALGSKIRGMMSQLTSAGNHSHFARLFLKQLVQMCKGPHVKSWPVDTPDADLLGMLGADGLGRLKRLEQRLVQPHRVVGPCPPPSFTGHQEFFKDFLQTASCSQLNQHLQDSLRVQLLQLDEVSIEEEKEEREQEVEEEGEGRDMGQQDEKQRFTSVLVLARLLAKFLGFISFLPYQTSERPSREVQEAAVALRGKSVLVLDVCGVLRQSMRSGRVVLTVPWLVEFLSMMDFTAPLLPHYRSALGTLLLLYRRMLLSRCEEMCYLNKLLVVSMLGWLFQIPVIPEDMFFTGDGRNETNRGEGSNKAAGLDCIPLVDQQLLYTCCPYLGEFRKLLAAFVSGSTARSGGIIRKITPTSAEPRDAPGASKSQQKLQMDLEQAFFHNQPPSLRRTVEFVAERVGSNAVKHIKATLVSELVERGEKMLRGGLETPKYNASKLNDLISAQLCEAGLESLDRATRFCSEKSPEAIRMLLPDDTSPVVLATSENITKHLATVKARSWLSANISALIRREWKSRFERVMKSVCSPEEAEAPLEELAAAATVAAAAAAAAAHRRKSGSGRADSCPPHCKHGASLPSDVLIAMKDLLSVAVGPRHDQELPTPRHIQKLLQEVGDTLDCRKFSTVMSEQMLLNCTVVLACKLVSAELPLLAASACSQSQSQSQEPAPGPEVTLTDLLEQLVGLWAGGLGGSAPLRLLFTPLAVTAALRAGNAEWSNYLFLVKLLVDRGVLREEEVTSHWKSLANQSLPMELKQKLWMHTQTLEPSLDVSDLQSQVDVLQLSQQTVEGAT